MTIIVAVVALTVGVVAGWLIANMRSLPDVQRAVVERDLARDERQRSDAALAELRRRLDGEQQLRVASETKTSHLESSRQQMEDTFYVLAQRAFRNVGEGLMQMNKAQVDGSLDTKTAAIDALLTPVREMLDKYRAEVMKSEQVRSEAYGGLQEQIRSLLTAQEAAQREASRLANALQSPTVQGSWGEMSLRRCIELAGMTEHCGDFETQPTFFTDEGRRLRPDVIINLPHKRVIAIDAKAPLNDFSLASNEPDEARKRVFLEQHAKTVRRHVETLSRREYQSSIGETLDFTVMFIPGEHFLAAALATDPSLLDFAAQKRIFLATPTVLIPLLRAIYSSWKAEKTEENAKKMHDAGVDLFNRFVKVMDHLSEVGAALAKTVEKYNGVIRSIDTRLWPKGEEMQRMAGSGKELGNLEQLEAIPLESSKLRLTMQSEEEGELIPMRDPVSS